MPTHTDLCTLLLVTHGSAGIDVGGVGLGVGGTLENLVVHGRDHPGHRRHVHLIYREVKENTLYVW
jgi:hypothetical protein